MLSILIPARNGREMTQTCLQSVQITCARLGIERNVEYILLDDNSDERQGVTQLFTEFRATQKCPVTVVRFKKWQHYTGVFSHGLSIAKGDQVLFISNDMALSPAFLRTVLGVSAMSASHGIVRGRSQHTDSHPEYSLPLPPMIPHRNFDDVFDYAEMVARYHGLEYREDQILSGDCVLIRRELINAIGVMDTRFFGYFGDPDYGLRTLRAGFKLVCAMGAWLHHGGAGHVKVEAAEKNMDMSEAHRKRMELVHSAFAKFREKWGPAIPPTYDFNRSIAETFGVAALRNQKAPTDYIAPLPHDPAVYDLL